MSPGCKNNLIINQQGSAEVSLKRALGCSKKRLLRQHLLEIGLVGLAGGALGLLVAPAAHPPQGGLQTYRNQIATDIVKTDGDSAASSLTRPDTGW